MKRYFFLVAILFVLVTVNVQSHDLAIADIDLDGTADTICIDRNKEVVFAGFPA